MLSQPISRKARIESRFPKLTPGSYRIVRRCEAKYNCIAWATGDSRRWWWPGPPDCTYWPDDVPRQETVPAFIMLFEKFRYACCDHGNRERWHEKIAIYAKDGIPTHAARQLSNGKWTSKLGSWERIEHEIEGLVGSEYGSIVQIMKRPKGLRRIISDAIFDFVTHTFPRRR
jgi:hypothetical protein